MAPLCAPVSPGPCPAFAQPPLCSSPFSIIAPPQRPHFPIPDVPWGPLSPHQGPTPPLGTGWCKPCVQTQKPRGSVCRAWTASWTSEHARPRWQRGPGLRRSAWGPLHTDLGDGPAPGHGNAGEGADICLAPQTPQEACISQVGPTVCSAGWLLGAWESGLWAGEPGHALRTTGPRQGHKAAMTGTGRPGPSHLLRAPELCSTLQTP